MILTRRVLNRMIAQTYRLGLMGERDRLIMRALYESDLTVAELVRIRNRDVDLRAKTFMVRGVRPRRIVIERRLFSQITFYRERVCGFLGLGDRHERLFLYDFRTPFTVRDVRRMLEVYRRAAGLSAVGEDDAC